MGSAVIKCAKHVLHVSISRQGGFVHEKVVTHDNCSRGCFEEEEDWHLIEFKGKASCKQMTELEHEEMVEDQELSTSDIQTHDIPLRTRRLIELDRLHRIKQVRRWMIAIFRGC